MSKATHNLTFPASGDAFTIANFNNAFNAAYQGDVAPLRPRAHTVPDMGISIGGEGGCIVEGFYSQIYASGDFPMVSSSGDVTFVKPDGAARIDLVYASGDRFWQLNGGEEITPSIPRFPSGDAVIPVCLVYHKGTEAKIVNYEDMGANPNEGYIYRDVRPMLSVVAGGKISKSIGIAKGDLIVYTDKATPTRLGVGTDAYILTADSSVSEGIKWSEPSSVAPTIFSTFGGDASTSGDVVILDNVNFSTHDDANRPGVAQYASLTINASKTLTIDTGWAYIGVTGTLTINGTINADGQGEEGGDVVAIVDAVAHYLGKIGASVFYDFTTSAVQGVDMTSVGTPPAVVAGLPQCEIPNSLGGAGGGGGGTDEYYTNCEEGGAGGGAGNSGGLGGEAITNSHSATFSHVGAVGNATTTAKKIILLLGVGDNVTSIKGFNQSILKFSRGAGGGSGGIAVYSEGYTGTGNSGVGGKGGGVIYIECVKLVCGANGVITADGVAGGNAANTSYTIPGGGGGGGGGTIIIRTKDLDTAPQAANVTVIGGVGGTGSTGGANGGAGAVGFKDIVEVD